MTRTGTETETETGNESGAGSQSEAEASELLASTLRELAESLRADPPLDLEHGSAVELAGLLPCEPATGPAAVACWRTQGGGERYELIELVGAMRIDDPVALREALTLLAMTEAVEALADPATLKEMRAALVAWRDRLRTSRATGLDALAEPAVVTVTGPLERVIERACTQIDELTKVGQPRLRIARPQRLDALGAALRALEGAWMQLEQAAEAWSDRMFATCGSEEEHADVVVVRSLVQELWQAMLLARRGPLAAPVGGVLQAGRSAGRALAAEVADGRLPGRSNP